MINNFRKNFILYVVLFFLSSLLVSNAAIIPTDPENPEETGWRDENAYRPNPVLFLHGFAAGSNYDWNPNPNARDQAAEQKKATAVFKKWFFDENKYYQKMGKALDKWTQFPYLETIEFFDFQSDKKDQVIDRNSSVDTYKDNDRYVNMLYRAKGDPGWSDKVSRVITGGDSPPHKRLYYLLSPSQTGFIQNRYKAPTGSFGNVKVNIVAHSMGGLAAREYLTNQELYSWGPGSVDKLITTGTANLGSHLASVANGVTAMADNSTILSRFPSIRWLWLAKRILKKLDEHLENKAWIDMDGDAAYDQDIYLKLGSGFLAGLNNRLHPSGVRYYVIYGSVQEMELIEGFTVQDLISELVRRGIPRVDIEEILSVIYGIDISYISEMVASEIGDGVVSLNSQRGWNAKENKRVFDLYKEEQITASHVTEPIEVADRAETSPLFKMLDDTKPVIEFTEIKNFQGGIIWQIGQEYFEVPQDGRIKVHGLCKKEYLPADTYINIGFRKAGKTEINWITETGGLTTNQSEANAWLLQPSDLWRASDPDSPVAEFEVEIDFPLQEVTHSIVVEATNPAGLKSEMVEVSEKIWFMYGVGMGDNGEAKLWCMDGPASFADGVATIVSEFSLVDEQGQNISSKPLDIATSGDTIWISFADKKIYAYDRITIKPKQLAGGKYYYTTTGTPDGLYYDGNLQYCSSITNKLYRISSSGIETDLGVIKRRLSLDGVATDSLSVNYTTQEYTGYNPNSLSGNYLVSAGLGKISKRNLSIGAHFIQTIPAGTPIWTNEQNTTAPVVGIIEVTDYSVPGDTATYLSCTDGNIYKVRFNDKVGIDDVSPVMWTAEKRDHRTLDYAAGSFSSPTSPGRVGRLQWWSAYDNPVIYLKVSNTERTYSKSPLLPSFIEAFVIHRAWFSNWRERVLETGSYEKVIDTAPYPVANTTFNICSFNESWTPEQIYNNPVLSTFLWTHPYDGPGIFISEQSPTVRVTDVTNVIPTTQFYYTGRYGNESQDLIQPAHPEPWLAGDIHKGQVLNGIAYADKWSFLTDNGSLKILDQFAMPATIAEGITIGQRVKIRIEPDTLSLNVGQTGQLKVNGKGPYTWSSSDDTVAVIEGISEATVTVKTVGEGIATITVQDSLGNMAKATLSVSAL